MEIFEGVKVSKNLLEQVLSNPKFTFGFEAEFFIESIGNKLRPIILKNIVDHPYGIGKPLRSLSWADVLNYFQCLRPLITEYESIKSNLNRAYQIARKNKKDDTSELLTAPSKMFSYLKKIYEPHQIMMLLGIYPKNGFVGLTEEQEDDLKKMILRRDVEEITPYRKLNDLTYFIGIDENDLDINFIEDLGTRELAYAYLSKSFSEIFNEPINHTIITMDNKHLTRGYLDWGLSPDKSLIGESEGVIGAELISPVKQIQTGIEQLIETISYMRNPRGPFKGIRFVTTPATGLHINMGIENTHIDYIKLLMLLGDEYIARKFERDQKVTAEPIIKMIKREKKPQNITDILTSMTNRMTASTYDINIVHKYLETNVPMSKYASVNLSKLNSQGFIEFRSIGNRNYHMKIDDIIQTVHRMAVVMQIATDPALYRKEFLTKLYKFILNAAKDSHITISKSHQDAEQALTDSVGMVGHGARGGYGTEAKPYITSPMDGETWVDEYGVDFGSNTQ